MADLLTFAPGIFAGDLAMFPQPDGKYVRLSDATARIAELEADRDRTERNRDMWKGQCERQALTLEALRIAIKEHNDGCNSACNARRAAGKTSCPMLGYDRDCGDCPRDWLIESMNIHPLSKEVEA